MAVSLNLAKKQTSNNTYKNSKSDYLFDDEEIEVAQILLQLPQLLFESDSRPSFPFSWGAKRRRSAIDGSPSPPRRYSPLPPPPLPSLSPASCNGEKPVFKVEASSPASPLSFSPSESDSKRKPSKRKASKKKRKEDWEEAVADLTHQRETLRKELAKVMDYYEKQKTLNLELKARQLELSLCREREDYYLNSSKRSLVERGRASPAQDEEEVEEEDEIPIIVYQQPLIMDQTVYGSEMFENSQYPYAQMPPSLSSGVGLGTTKHLSPLGIPDLNFTAEESIGMDFLHPFDLNRAAVSAEARKRRIEIKRVKRSMASVKPRFR